ncbi:MAG: MFS transporter [Victivallaceae bacterium]|nr:MFS transporter [Victivallaceae bacterium]
MTNRHGSFSALYTTNFRGVMNDNFLKTLAMFAVTGWISDPKTVSVWLGVTAGMLVLPYVFFSPLAGRMTGWFSKVSIVLAAKYAEIPIMAVAVAGFAFRSVPLLVFSVFLMGLQSALFSPAKYALIRDIGGVERLPTGLGGMEGVSFAAMLAGTVLASVIVDRTQPPAHYVCLFALAVSGVAAGHFIRAGETRLVDDITINPVRFLFDMHREVSKTRGLDVMIVYAGIFWWAAATMQMGLLQYGKGVLGLSSFHTGVMLAVAAIGITLGNVIAGIVARKRNLLVLIPFIGGFCAIMLFLMGSGTLGAVPFTAALTLLAFSLGFFKLPFNIEIQRMVRGPRLNIVLSYLNQTSFLFILLASATFMLCGVLFGVSAFMTVAGAVLLVSSLLFVFLHRGCLCRMGRLALAVRYDIETTGLELLEEGNGRLVMPNHVALVDPLILHAEFWRTRVRPLVGGDFFHINRFFTHVLGLLGAIGVPDLSIHRDRSSVEVARGLAGKVTEALGRGDCVLFYPSGHITTDGTESIGNRSLGYDVCSALPKGTRVLMVRTSGLWGSMWSRFGRRSSPPFAATLLKALGIWGLLLLVPHRRRKVRIEIADMTESIAEWSGLPRREFNAKLEDWYNGSNCNQRPLEK